MYKFIFFIFSIFLSNGVFSQYKSFLVQLKTNERLRIQNTLNRSIDKNSVVQKCDLPLNIWVVEGPSLEEVRNQLAKENEILFITENRKIVNRKRPNDTLYTKQWQYKNTGTNSNNGTVGADINAESAWDITTGGKTATGDDIVVAIIDDGFDPDHEDLMENVWSNQGEINDDGIDNDGNGYIDDINGWNISTNAGNINTNLSHGTSVCGIIGAKGNNKIGVTGVNWDVKLMMITYGNASEADVIAAYAYPYKMRKLYNETNGQKGAFVVATNSSFGQDGGDPKESFLWCAMYDSLGSVGIISAGATSNANVNVDAVGDLPSTCESEFLIAVTNLDSKNVKVSAGFGKKSVDLGAFGAGTFTVDLNNNYNGFGGTSAATPHVAGAVALLYSIACERIGEYYLDDPAGMALYIKDIILSNTTFNNSLRTNTTTQGRLNLGKSTHVMNKFCEDCIPLGSLKADPIKNSRNVKVSWYETKNPLVNLRYRKFIDTTWLDTLVTAPSATKSSSLMLENLDFCTDYIYQTRYKCLDTLSQWGYNKFFKSSGCCEAPNDISITIKDSVATIVNVEKDKIMVLLKSSNDNDIDTLISTDSLLTIAVNGLCNQYYFDVSRFCSIQNKFSPPSKPYIINTKCYACTKEEYCRFNTLDNSSEWIESVTINGKTNKSGKDRSAFGSYFGTIIPELEIGDTINAEITPGFANSTFGEKFNIFIDWDQNQTFSPNERVIFNDVSIGTTYSSKALIPLDAKLGHTRMRITMTFSGNGDPCTTTAEYGEYEDYCVLIVPSSNTNDEEKDNKFYVIPNPNNGRFLVKSHNIINEIQIFNMLGEHIFTQKSDSKEENISIPYSKGVYHIFITTSQGVYTQKFILIE
jgi:hypothetical protein